MTLVGTDRTAQRVIVLERSAEAERQNGGVLEAVGDDAGMVFLCLLTVRLSDLLHSGGIFRAVFGDDDSEIAGRKEKGLISK